MADWLKNSRIQLQQSKSNLMTLHFSLRSENQKYYKLYKELQEAFSWRADPKKLENQLRQRVEELKQAKEYIKQLEGVVEKSRDNILFLKDLVTK
jgi:septal ring factor EnvC (AmiA/AmiB activator)